MVGIEEVRAELKRRYDAGDPEAVGSYASFSASMIFRKAQLGYSFPKDVCHIKTLVEPGILEDVQTYPNLVLRSLEEYTAAMLEEGDYPLPKVNEGMETLEGIADYSRQLCGILGGGA